MSARPLVEMACVDLSVVKRCACCGNEYDRSWWDTLPLVGYQTGETEATVLELRNSRCGSTLALEIPAEERES